MFKIGWNGRKYYVTCCEYGPYRDVIQAMHEADRLNRIKFGPSQMPKSEWNPETSAQRRPS